MANCRISEVDVDALARDQRLTAPEFASITTDGAALSISARTARPGSDEEPAVAVDLVAAYEVPDGLRIDLTAAEGRLDRQAGRVAMSGGVEIVTSTGYLMTTAGLDGALDQTELHSRRCGACRGALRHDRRRKYGNHP